MIRVSVVFTMDIDGELPLEIQDKLVSAVEEVEGHNVHFDWEPVEESAGPEVLQ